MPDKKQRRSISDGDASLKAVLFFDLVDSSRLMSARELETVEFLRLAFAVFQDACDRHGGELIKTTGDGALVLFGSATQAIEYALDVHRRLEELPSDLDERPAFRAGLHVGEVIYSDGDVYGHAVNVAARLESVAGNGETCISAEAFALARRSSRFEFEALGGRRLKNIPDHMSVYVVRERGAVAPPVNTPRLDISTIGGLRLDGGQGPAPAQATHDLRLAPIGYLALNANAMEAIGRLCALFWPHREPSAARRALARLMRRVIELYGDVCFRDATSAGLVPGAFSVDLETMERDVRSGRLHPMLLRSGDWSERILAGTEEIGMLYAAWLLVTRSDWRNRIAQALELCLDHFQLGDDGMRDAATALLRIESGHERAARLLIRHYHTVGNPGAAVRVYQDLERELDERFGIAPKPETLAAARGAEEKAGETTEIRRRGPDAAPLRIQVMDFVTADGERSARLQSFRSEVLASLARFRGWVLAEGAQPAAGRDESSDYRLDAEEQPGESGTRIALKLSEVHGGRVVWSDILPFGEGEFLAAERGAVARIAAALEIYLTTDRLAASRPDPARAVIDDWLRAEHLFSRWTRAAHDEAQQLLEDIVAQAPDYAPGQASLAGLHNVSHIVRPGYRRDPAADARTYAMAERAAEIDPLNARIQMVVAWSASLAGDFDKASMHMEMAAKMNPNSPRTLVSCAMGFAFFGEHDRALAALEHSLDCSPMLLGYQWCYAGSVYFLAGNPEAALQAVIRGRDAIIDNAGWHAAILSALGRPDEAEEAFDRLVAAVRPIWAGETPGGAPATREAIYEWFKTAYPMRRDQERRKLAFLG